MRAPKNIQSEISSEVLNGGRKKNHLQQWTIFKDDFIGIKIFFWSLPGCTLAVEMYSLCLAFSFASCTHNYRERNCLCRQTTSPSPRLWFCSPEQQLWVGLHPHSSHEMVRNAGETQKTRKSSGSVQTKLLGGITRSMLENADAWWPRNFFQYSKWFSIDSLHRGCLFDSLCCLYYFQP